MSIEEKLIKRSDSKCEICSDKGNLSVYKIPPVGVIEADKCIYLCETCSDQIENPDNVDANHWRCLNESMWSETPAVQVMSWRMLTRLKGEGWPQDLLDMMYLDDETIVWAKATGEGEEAELIAKHVDSTGVELQSGDSIVLIKDLNVKGAGFTAKRGTPVRRISLVADNPDQISGRINGQQIIILTQFVKKS
jgi:protein PhnA